MTRRDFALLRLLPKGRAAVSNLPLWGRGTTKWWMRFLKVSISQPHPSLALLVPPSPRGKVEGASLREGGAEQSEAEGARVSLFIYRRLFRTLNNTQAPSVTFGATSLSEGGLDNPSPLRGAVSPAGSVTSRSALSVATRQLSQGASLIRAGAYATDTRLTGQSIVLVPHLTLARFCNKISLYNIKKI